MAWLPQESGHLVLARIIVAPQLETIAGAQRAVSLRQGSVLAERSRVD